MYKDKEWLFNEYIVKGRNAEEIASEFGVCRETIYLWTRKFKFPKKTNFQLDPSMLYQNKDWLYEHFVVKGKTAKEIADMFDVGESTVSKWTTVFNLRKMHYRNKQVSVKCTICGKEHLRSRTNHYAHLKQGRTNFYCGMDCYKESRRRRIQAVNMYLMQERPETGIESKIYKVLEDMDINFRAQEKIAFWVADFYLPDYNLIIETNGDYWHANPEMYKPEELNEKQQVRIKNDYFKLHGLQHRGYRVLVLWEKDINKRLDWCVNQIKEAIRTVS